MAERKKILKKLLQFSFLHDIIYSVVYATLYICWCFIGYILVKIPTIRFHMEGYLAFGEDSLTLRLVSKLPDLRVANAKWGRLRALPAADKASKKEWQRSKFDERTRVTNFGYRNRT